MTLRWHYDRHRVIVYILAVSFLIISYRFGVVLALDAELRSAGAAGLGVDTDMDIETEMSASRVEEKVRKQSPAFM